MMPNLYLPIHVWDREIDSRLVISYLSANAGIDTLIGHEYNMSPMYPRDKHACLFKQSAPLDHNIRGGWHRDITIRGGTVITHDEEGVNNMPLEIEQTNRGKIVHLDIERVNLVKKSVVLKQLIM